MVTSPTSNYSATSEECTNYWTYDRNHSLYPSGAYNGSKWSAKIPGDDSAHLMDVFEEFLQRQKGMFAKMPALLDGIPDRYVLNRDAPR